MATLPGPVDDVVGPFVDVALSDPVSAVLLLCGVVIIGFASAVMGYLTLGALVDLLTPAPGGPPERH